MLIGLVVLLRNPTAAGSKLAGTGLPGGITLENSADGGIFALFDWRFVRNMARQMINPMPTTPPTVPPTIAPILLLDPPVSVGAGDELEEAGELETDEGEEETGGVLVDVALAEVEPEADDSGCWAAACAMDASNTSVPSILMYAQAGTEVAPGILRG